MIQTSVLVSVLRGLNFDIEPNEMIKPNGKEPASVTINNFKVDKKPILSDIKTVGNCSINLLISSPF